MEFYPLLPIITTEIWEGQIGNVVDEVGFHRFSKAKEEGAMVIKVFMEPYRSNILYEFMLERLLCLHVLARIIDDGVDIGLPEDRFRLLKTLPFLWKIASELQSCFPSKQAVIQDLIEQWCTYNDPRDEDLEGIGYKNLHLLLPELILNHGVHLSLLRRSLFLLQIVDELEFFDEERILTHIALHGSLSTDVQTIGFHELAKLMQNNYECVMIHFKRR